MTELVEKLFDQNWNHKNRDNIIKRLQNNQYDIIIIGTGITGAGIAREAALRFCCRDILKEFKTRTWWHTIFRTWGYRFSARIYNREKLDEESHPPFSKTYPIFICCTRGREI